MFKLIVFQWLWGYSYFEGLATGSLIVDNAIVDSGTLLILSKSRV